MQITSLYGAGALRISNISYQRKAFASKWVRRFFSTIISSRIEQFETRENGCCPRGGGESHCFRSVRKLVPETRRNRNGMTFFCRTHELKAQERLHVKAESCFQSTILGKQTKTWARANHSCLSAPTPCQAVSDLAWDQG